MWRWAPERTQNWALPGSPGPQSGPFPRIPGNHVLVPPCPPLSRVLHLPFLPGCSKRLGPVTFSRVHPSDGGCRPVVAQTLRWAERLTRGGRTCGSQWGRGAQQGSGCSWGAGRGVGPARSRGCVLGGGPQRWESAAPQPMTVPRCCLRGKHPSLPTHLDKAGKRSREELSQGPPPGSHPTSLQTVVTELTTDACLGPRDPHPHEDVPSAASGDPAPPPRVLQTRRAVREEPGWGLRGGREGRARVWEPPSPPCPHSDTWGGGRRLLITGDGRGPPGAPSLALWGGV